MLKTAIVTAANSKFFPLLQNLLASLEPFVDGRERQLCVYDLGLEAGQVEHLKDLGIRLQKPGWDITWPQLKSPPPDYKKYVTVAPFTPRYFPGFELYFWIDCDTWCQDDRGLELYLKGAATKRLAIVPVLDRSFQKSLSGAAVRTWPPLLGGFRRRTSTYLHNVIKRYYGRAEANELFFKPVLSAGVYALHAQAPHWRAWEKSLRRARFRRGTDLSDQSPLNHAVYTNGLPVSLLPSYANWHCHAALPAFDEEAGIFVEPNLPHEKISIMHLVGWTKYQQHEIETLEGRTLRLSLDYKNRPPLEK